MSFRAATGVRFDSSVVLSSALSRHHCRHRFSSSSSGARLVRFLRLRGFPSERKKERKKKEEPPKAVLAGFGETIDVVRFSESLLGERASIEAGVRKRERDLRNVRNQSSSFVFFAWWCFYSLKSWSSRFLRRFLRRRKEGSATLVVRERVARRVDVVEEDKSDDDDDEREIDTLLFQKKKKKRRKKSKRTRGFLSPLFFLIKCWWR